MSPYSITFETMGIVKQLPEKLLESLEGLPGFNRTTFVKVHEEGSPVTSIRFNPLKAPLKFASVDFPFRNAGNVPWSANACYLSARPSFTFDPFFHAGLYYVQEASSMFLEQALKQLLPLDQDLKLLDLCAAPGGKSTHIQSLISKNSLLVSNEVIKSRSHILVDNIIKWGCSNVMVTNNDPSAFQKLEGFFDVMVVDAPCSGSGLFRRDEDAIDEWSPGNVQLCSQRQQRILADALPCLKENGILIYSTCSYSREEDEVIMDWLVDEMGMENLPLEVNPDWKIIEGNSTNTNSVGYRFYPDQLKGEGFFLSCFRKKDQTKTLRLRPGKIDKAGAKEKAIIQKWLKNEDCLIIREDDKFFALQSTQAEAYSILASALRVVYRGIELGQIMKDRLVPSHALALSKEISENIPHNELSYDDAILYLQRAELHLETETKGWQLVRYGGQNLGWVNVLANRVNNYYPKELRILKQQNDSSFKK